MKRTYFSESPTHAVVAYFVDKYNQLGQNALGRTALQKLCYFSKARGVPLSFSFEIHHYGPFSVDLFRVTDELIADRVIEDQFPNLAQSAYTPGPLCRSLLNRQRSKIKKYGKTLDRIVELFQGMPASQLELITTIHYIYCSQRLSRKPKKNEVVNSVFRIKRPKFSRLEIDRTFQMLNNAKLLTWSPQKTF